MFPIIKERMDLVVKTYVALHKKNDPMIDPPINSYIFTRLLTRSTKLVPSYDILPIIINITQKVL